MIQFQNVSKKFSGLDGPVSALDQVSLTIEDHELFGVIGESGAGKSTLLRFINALESPDSGSVIVDDRTVNQLSKKALRQHQKEIGMVFQQFNLLSNKTVQQNTALPLNLHRYEHPLSVDQVLEFVGLSDKKNQYPAQLSGGQKQRVGIARALISRPKLLLCDEPTSALDQNTTEEIVDVLKKAHQEFGMTIVIVTHELGVIKELCDRAAIMENGKVVNMVEVKRSSTARNVKPYRERAMEVLSYD